MLFAAPGEQAYHIFEAREGFISLDYLLVVLKTRKCLFYDNICPTLICKELKKVATMKCDRKVFGSCETH